MINIGYKIRELRKQNDMTLKDLSDKVKLSVSFLSGIERNVYSPSLETVSELSDIFDITISQLLGEENKNKIKVIRKDERRVMLTENEQAKLQLISKPANIDSKLELKIIDIGPMMKASKWKHSHTGEEVIHVLEGRATISICGETYCIEKGDTIHFDATLSHGFENKEDMSLKLMICTSPPDLSPLVRETR